MELLADAHARLGLLHVLKFLMKTFIQAAQ